MNDMPVPDYLELADNPYLHQSDRILYALLGIADLLKNAHI